MDGVRSRFGSVELLFGLAGAGLGQAGISSGGGFGIRPREYFCKARPRIRHQRSTQVNCGAFWISRRKRFIASNAARNPAEALCAIVSSKVVCRLCFLTRATPSIISGRLVFASRRDSGSISRTNSDHQL